ncbi:hypothetical protein INT47_011980 [Mucor saturninus]|uniref:Uncharacterized protein n=1 Tax=Mucor saturninus TaxID=64648 RepID=A0A8H7V839_9FUNG|nr:hypothetical protein INT47_011980 [Mucor saturninus]
MERNECPCADFGQLITRDRFLTCRTIDADLIDSLPASPLGVHRIDFALNSLPTKKKHKPPAFWPKLLSLLWMIDTLCHPLSNIPEDPARRIDLRILHDRIRQGQNVETDIGAMEASEEQPGDAKYIFD